MYEHNARLDCVYKKVKHKLGGRSYRPCTALLSLHNYIRFDERSQENCSKYKTGIAYVEERRPPYGGMLLVTPYPAVPNRMVKIPLRLLVYMILYINKSPLSVPT